MTLSYFQTVRINIFQRIFTSVKTPAYLDKIGYTCIFWYKVSSYIVKSSLLKTGHLKSFFVKFLATSTNYRVILNIFCYSRWSNVVIFGFLNCLYGPILVCMG